MIKVKMIDDFLLRDNDFDIIIDIQKNEEVCILYKLYDINYTTGMAFIIVSKTGEAITLDSGFFKLSDEEKDKIKEFKF